ncbi:MAG TPA: M23 family metallopeptidase [Microbacterium sp.]|uniref:murein hydrolase activator EnvC family protein n=1 Tax=Microbacterium sp. TaxID=51671 RepID=UPI002B9E28B1|nr:M23 family metallopeptidase [Microbacterium sp.]HWI32238.1 M23 family metallopeptidase [Microbacterium sp.]
MRRVLCTATLVVMFGMLACVGAPRPASAVPAAPGAPAVSGTSGWVWPVDPPFRLAEPYVAPAHDYAPGHRGIDLEPLAGHDVLAPADGVVAFVGRVVDRDIVTIDHGGGLVTTLEPVVSELVPGAEVAGGDVVGTLGLGGHAAHGTLHFGVRRDGRYINPMLLLGGVPRAVLVPCCDAL